MNSKNIFSMLALTSHLLLNGCVDSSGDNEYNPRNPYGLGPAGVSSTPANGMASAESYVILSRPGSLTLSVKYFFKRRLKPVCYIQDSLGVLLLGKDSYKR